MTRATEPLGRLHGSPPSGSSASAIVTGAGRELLGVWKPGRSSQLYRAGFLGVMAVLRWQAMVTVAEPTTLIKGARQI